MGFVTYSCGNYPSEGVLLVSNSGILCSSDGSSALRQVSLTVLECFSSFVLLGFWDLRRGIGGAL